MHTSNGGAKADSEIASGFICEVIFKINERLQEILSTILLDKISQPSLCTAGCKIRATSAFERYHRLSKYNFLYTKHYLSA